MILALVLWSPFVLWASVYGVFVARAILKKPINPNRRRWDPKGE